MGIFGKAIGSAFGAGIGSFWDAEKDGAGIGGTIGSWLPFQKGGKVPSVNLYAGGYKFLAGGGIPRQRPQPVKRGGKMKMKMKNEK